MTPTDFPQGMDFLKQFWQSGASAPAAPAASPFAAQPNPAFAQAMGHYMLPTFDLEELDKRMSDMRTVLHFMDMNTQLLRQSLGALEVQRNTLITLQSMAKPAAPTSDAQGNASASAATAPWLAAWQGMMQAASQSAAPEAAAKTAPSKKAASKSASQPSQTGAAKKPSRAPRSIP